MNRITLSILIIWLTIIGYFYLNNKKTDIYTYENLWIKITTHKPTNQLKKRKNLIYNKNNTSDYIEVFFKDSEKDFEEEIQKHISSWCNIKTRTEEIGHPISSQTKWFQVIATNLDGDENCNTESEFPISFYMDQNKPDKYYKFSYKDCAPGPCSIFKDIEFF